MPAAPPSMALITSVARQALGAPDARVTSWRMEPASYRVINQATAGLRRASGTASIAGAVQTWAAFVKILRHVPHDTSDFSTSDDPGHWNYWQREAHVYTSSLLDELPPGLAAPRCYALETRSDGAIWLWLEAIDGLPGPRWPLARFGLAAEHLGRFQGRYAARGAVPQREWLSRDWLRAWIPSRERAALELLRDPGAWRHPLLDACELPALAALERLWETRGALLASLAHVPRTLCHLDVWPHNMFSRRAGCDDETVLIDWSQTGPGALSEDIANLVLDSVWMQVIDGEALRSFEQLALDGYLRGLRAAGWGGEAWRVRHGYAVVGALRFGLLAGAVLQIVHDPAMHTVMEQRYGRPVGQVVANRMRVVGHALRLADEAYARLGTERQGQPRV